MTEMSDREKIIKGLECCTQSIIKCESNCPYAKVKRNVWMNCYDVLMDDARALLKAQEARVMTLEEALAADYVYLEIKLHASLPCNCCILAVDPDGGILPLHKGFCAYLDGEDYGIDWRCWSARPTDEQREGTPWQVT